MPTHRTPSPSGGRLPQDALPPASPLSVLLVDDHPDLRDVLKYIIDLDPAFAVCGLAASAPEALRLAKALRPRLAVLDIALEEGDGLELARLLRRLDPGMAIVFFSLDDHAATVRQALQLGALGFVGKGEPLQNLLQAIRRAGDGQPYLNERLARHLGGAARPAAAGEATSGPLKRTDPSPAGASHRQQLARKWGFSSFDDLEAFLRNDDRL